LNFQNLRSANAVAPIYLFDIRRFFRPREEQPVAIEKRFNAVNRDGDGRSTRKKC